MNRFELDEMLKRSKPIKKEEAIQQLCSGKKVLDLGCIRHRASFAVNDPHWLHKKIIEVAKEVTGVDFLEEEVNQLKAMGYSNIIYGDVTKPINLVGGYEVIVAGDLIEHLNNFEGFFSNCMRLLAENGIIVISTPNPFYSELFHYIALKRHYLVNPEHTCWIDPQCLSQLCQRFGFVVKSIKFIEISWKLNRIICETKYCYYDALSGSWINDTKLRKIARKMIAYIISIPYFFYKKLTLTSTYLTKYSDYIAVLSKCKRNESDN